MSLVWILFGTLALAGAFFVVSFAQVLGIEARLRRLVVETEGRLSRTYSLKLVPPGRAAPGAEPERQAAAPEEVEEEE